MHNLLDFIKKYNYWFLFIFLEIISIVLLFRFNSCQGSIWFTAANDVTAKVNSYYTDFYHFVHLKDVNKNLTSQNLQLQMQVTQLRDILAEKTKKQSKNEQVVNDSLAGYTLIPARVYSNSILKNENYLVIDKGENDGIKTEMGVVGGGGIVGIVFLTSKHYSLVMAAINTKSNISCRIRHHHYFGYLQWNGGSTLTGDLNDLPRYATRKVAEFRE